MEVDGDRLHRPPPPSPPITAMELPAPALPSTAPMESPPSMEGSSPPRWMEAVLAVFALFVLFLLVAR